MKGFCLLLRDAFLYSDRKLSAGKSWATVFCVLFVVAYVMRLCGVKHISDTFVGITLGALGTVVGFYTISKFSNNRNNGGPQ